MFRGARRSDLEQILEIYAHAERRRDGCGNCQRRAGAEHQNQNRVFLDEALEKILKLRHYAAPFHVS